MKRSESTLVCNNIYLDSIFIYLYISIFLYFYNSDVQTLTLRSAKGDPWDESPPTHTSKLKQYIVDPAFSHVYSYSHISIFLYFCTYIFMYSFIHVLQPLNNFRYQMRTAHTTDPQRNELGQCEARRGCETRRKRAKWTEKDEREGWTQIEWLSRGINIWEFD